MWVSGGFSELAPLISDKIGYLGAVSTIVELVLICILPAAIILKWITAKGNSCLQKWYVPS